MRVLIVVTILGVSLQTAAQDCPGREIWVSTGYGGYCSTSPHPPRPPDVPRDPFAAPILKVNGKAGPCTIKQKSGIPTYNFNFSWCQRVYVAETNISYVIEPQSQRHLLAPLELQTGSYEASIDGLDVKLSTLWALDRRDNSGHPMWGTVRVFPSGTQKVKGMKGPREFTYKVLIMCKVLECWIPTVLSAGGKASTVPLPGTPISGEMSYEGP